MKRKERKPQGNPTAAIIRCYLYKELSKSDLVYKTPNCCKFSLYLGINDKLKYAN